MLDDDGRVSYIPEIEDIKMELDTVWHRHAPLMNVKLPQSCIFYSQLGGISLDLGANIFNVCV